MPNSLNEFRSFGVLTPNLYYSTCLAGCSYNIVSLTMLHCDDEWWLTRCWWGSPSRLGCWCWAEFHPYSDIPQEQETEWDLSSTHRSSCLCPRSKQIQQDTGLAVSQRYYFTLRIKYRTESIAPFGLFHIELWMWISDVMRWQWCTNVTDTCAQSYATKTAWYVDTFL